MNRTPVLLSRSLDPVLAVFTGALAFYLHENNPRTAPPQGETLRELYQWKMKKWAREREERDAAAGDGAPLAAMSALLKEEKGGI